MFKLFKATTIVSIATITYVIVGIIRAKFTAVTLGPTGVGIFSQAFNFQQLSTTITSFSIGLGITKYVSKYNAQKNDSSVEGIIRCAFLIQILASLVYVLFVVALSGMFSQLLFADNDYGFYLALFSLGIPFLVIASTSESILFGFGNYKAFAKGRSVSSIIGLIPLFIFIYTMRVRGGFIYLALNGVLTSAVFMYLLVKNVPRDLLNKIFDIKKIMSIKNNFKKFSRELLSYGGVSFVTGLLSLANVVFLRSLLIRFFGAEGNGYYQVVFAISAYHLMLFTNSLWSYFYPKISSLDNARDYSLEVNHAMRFCIFGVMPFIAGLFLFRNFIINILFSNKFIYSSELFATQLFGDLFFILFYIMCTSLLASTRLRAYLVFGILYSFSFIGFFLLAHRIFGLRAITISYMISNFAMFLLILHYHMKAMKLKIYMRNATLFLSVVMLGFVVLFLGQDNAVTAALKFILLFLWLFLLSTASERNRLFNILSSKAIGLVGARHES